MKNIKTFRLLLFVALLYSQIGQSQSMTDFFRVEGVADLAVLAHPTNTYKGGYFDVYRDEVIVEINYETVTTKLRIKREGDYFTRITTIGDSDWFPAFEAIKTIKDFLIEGTEDTQERRKLMSSFEERFDKAILDMTGKELACIILTLAWFAY